PSHSERNGRASLLFVDRTAYVVVRRSSETFSPAHAGPFLRRSTSCVERTKKAPPASGAQGNSQPMRFSGCWLERLPSTGPLDEWDTELSPRLGGPAPS